MMCSVPWSCVQRLHLQPVGPVDPICFGLRYVGYNEYEGGYDNPTGVFEVAEPRRVRQTRDALGEIVQDQRMKRLSPWYEALCSLHREISQ